MVTSFSKKEIEVTCNSVALSLEYLSLREQQKDVITKFVAGSDVFAISLLPTGYGKSLCYACLCSVFFNVLNSTVQCTFYL